MVWPTAKAVGVRGAARRSRNQTRLVRAGLVSALRKGTHEGCPYDLLIPLLIQEGGKGRN